MSIILDWLVPSRRHREEERHRLEWTRDETGQGDPHRGPIDLDSGVVTIKADADGDGRAVPDGTSAAHAADASTGNTTAAYAGTTDAGTADTASGGAEADLTKPTEP